MQRKLSRNYWELCVSLDTKVDLVRGLLFPGAGAGVPACFCAPLRVDAAASRTQRAACSRSSRSQLLNNNLSSVYCICRNMLKGRKSKKTNIECILALRNTNFSWDFKEVNEFELNI